MRLASSWYRSVCLALLTMWIGSTTSRGCLWDRDTVQMETQVFPDVLEVMTGQFPRHSAEFYQWRVGVVKAQLATTQGSPSAMDDLAVALHKLGRHQAAIDVMTASLKQVPGRYETLSNLGTFTIYAGDLSASRQWLKEALAVNPHAHFGREQYQLWLVEQVLLRRDATAFSEMLARFSEATILTLQSDYARFVQLQVNIREGWARGTPLRELTVEERDKAIQGVLGMMRFADFDNPLLQAALGDLLALQGANKKAPKLAALAYEHALMKTSDPATRDSLIARMVRASPLQAAKEMRIESAKKLDENLAAGRKLVAQVRTDEMAWMLAKQDVEAEFERKYLNAKPTVSFQPVRRR